MSDIAKAYVQIVPSAQGISGKISQALGGEAESAGKKAGGSFSSAFGAALKAAGAGIAAGAAGISALVKSSIESYANYEQLVGGVETLFKDSADVVQQYAADAYKTAGLSANEYMETVTGFSASLLQSLDGDTARAASTADMAITDMADNANKMGSSMESIQNAYQGFAKQNYTMLDNLKLGYGGTKSEMERLLADASEIAGVEFSIDSYADIIDAIHVIQTEMGITGTTAKEAGETISGSVSAMKSAWQNLVIGIADDNADFDALLDNVINSAITAAHNILPRLQQTLGGVGKLVEGLAPVIAEALPVLVEDVLPPLLSSATSLVGTIGEAILENLPLIVETGLELVLSLAEGIAENLPEIVPTVIDVILDIADILTAPDNLMAILNAGIAIIVALAGGIIDALPDLLKKGGEIIVNLATVIKEKAPEMLLAAAELLVKLLQGIGEWMSPVLEKGREVFETIKTGIIEKVETAKQWGRDLIQNFISGITEKWEALKDTVSKTAQKVRDFLGFSEPEEGPLSEFHTFAPDMMDLFIEGIRSKEQDLADELTTVASIVSDIFTGIKNTMDLRESISALEYELWERQFDAENTELKAATAQLEQQQELLKAAKEIYSNDKSDANKANVEAIQAVVDEYQKHVSALEDQAAFEKYTRQQEMLSAQIADQTDVVEAARAAYEQIVEKYGDGSDESLKYQKTLLKEQIAYEKLLGSLNDVAEAKQRLSALDANHALMAAPMAQDVSTADAVSGIVNGLQSAVGNGGGTYVINLVLDGQLLARTTLPALIEAARANGTPILNPA